MVPVPDRCVAIRSPTTLIAQADEIGEPLGKSRDRDSSATSAPFAGLAYSRRSVARERRSVTVGDELLGDGGRDRAIPGDHRRAVLDAEERLIGDHDVHRDGHRLPAGRPVTRSTSVSAIT